MKYIGLDVGDRRVGVAFGDSEVRVATPVEVIPRGSLAQDARVLAELVRQYDTTQLVVGLPRNMDGTPGPQADSVIAYAERLARMVNLPLVFWDERLTTVEATKRTQEAGVSAQTLRLGSARSLRRGKKARRGLDAIAAAVILQDFLDSANG
jgi:putative Holliday junction resolvase